ncbi:glycosyltransferase family 4 protein [Gaopeijia maritima]|uniref:glycosyltransferase n=1 Tax=Gaopeijia maritima TaxID=3119007 RepID=UPI0032500835
MVAAPGDSATPLRLAYLGTYPPRRCGIGTFTRDLAEAVAGRRDGSSYQILATTDAAGPYEYPDAVRFQLRQGEKQDYIRAADHVNFSDTRLVSVQHEFGIYGGDDGSHVLAFLSRLDKPVVATLHTVLREPSASQRSLVRAMAERCDGIVVMNALAADVLEESHGVSRSAIEVIPHGIPDLPRGDQDHFKERFGVRGRRMLLTFGLLSPNKGIETAIRALPRLVERFPDLVYFVVGATHPNVKRQRGEEYRIALEREALTLGVADHVVFRDEFVDPDELADVLRATDVYLTPYLDAAQSTSGTLSYAMGAGSAVVSTPYLHAREFLADGRGRMFGFGDSEGMAMGVEALLSDAGELKRTREAAWHFTRPMTWPRVGEAYAALAERVLDRRRGPAPQVFPRERFPVPEPSLDHVVRMTDDTGIIQHATYSVPARGTGYCVDDNSRALIVALRSHRLSASPRTASLMVVYLSYLESSQKSDGRFRNFMLYNRQLESHDGSDDCMGRALWALGECARWAPERGLRRLATQMFERALPWAPRFGPRGMATTILGLDAFIARSPDHEGARSIVGHLSDQLVQRYRTEADAMWRWFEPDVTYDNALIPLALFRAHEITRDPSALVVARQSLSFLERLCFEGGYLNLVGNEGWHRRGSHRAMADEQPVDAAAFVLAFRGAYMVTGDPHYRRRMRESFEWFLGRNRLATPLYDPTTSGCLDALGRHEVNENQGAESVLSFLLSLLAVLDVADPADPAIPAERSVASGPIA